MKTILGLTLSEHYLKLIQKLSPISLFYKWFTKIKSIQMFDFKFYDI